MKQLYGLMIIGFTALAGLATAQGMTMGESAMLSGLEGEDFEVAFLSMMIQHHEGAVDMAGWILERSQHSDIKAAAEAILAAQQPEIEQMTQWLQDWYARGVDTHSVMMMQGEMDTVMGNMEASSNPDAAFLQEMSMHHNSAIDMAQAALLKATHSELRDLAKNIIVAQAQEIAQYQVLRGYRQN
jgi:uncharacterized protein (DUF305 family)